MKSPLLKTSLAVIAMATGGMLLSGNIFAQSSTPSPRERVTVSPTPPTLVTTPPPTPKPTPNEEDEVIKIDTELVNVNVRVVDRNNRPVNNLQQKDFRVLEDNNPQEIKFFSQSEVPTN